MCGDPRMYELTSAMVNDKKHVQCLKPNGLNGEQITCPDLGAVLSQELSPTGGGFFTVWALHVSGDSPRTNVKAKTCQLRPDFALTPQWILQSHTANDFTEFGFDLSASRSEWAA